MTFSLVKLCQHHQSQSPFFFVIPNSFVCLPSSPLTLFYHDSLFISFSLMYLYILQGKDYAIHLFLLYDYHKPTSQWRLGHECCFGSLNRRNINWPIWEHECVTLALSIPRASRQNLHAFVVLGQRSHRQFKVLGAEYRDMWQSTSLVR